MFVEGWRRFDIIMIVKNIKKICAVIIILIFISVSTFLIDSCLAEDNKSPIFSFP